MMGIPILVEMEGGVSILSLNEVSKSFKLRDGLYKAVDRVSLEVKQGSIHGIIGASGAGKSTLLRMMNVLERPDQGTVTTEGIELTGLPEKQLRKQRQKIGMIFQQFNLVSNATVSRNVSMPLALAGLPKSVQIQRMKECLKFVGLEDKAEQYPAQLSGGERQRVAIARALANSPKLLLCDEPTSSLDPVTTLEILNVLKHVNSSLGVTIVLVTHELDVVKTLCSHVSVMESGRIIDSFSRDDGRFNPVANGFGSYREQILGDKKEERETGDVHV